MDVAVPTAMYLVAEKHLVAERHLVRRASGAAAREQREPRAVKHASQLTGPAPISMQCAGCCCCTVMATPQTLLDVDCAHRLNLRDEPWRRALQTSMNTSLQQWPLRAVR